MSIAMMNEQELWNCFDACDYYTISCIDQNGMPYAYITSLIRIDDTLYAHGSLTGKKMECFRHNENVFVSGCSNVCYDQNKTTAYYQSIHIQGKISLVNDLKEKQKVLEAIVLKYAKQNIEIKQVNHVGIYKIKCEKRWGKKKYD